jgi:hypothetical protein
MLCLYRDKQARLKTYGIRPSGVVRFEPCKLFSHKSVVVNLYNTIRNFIAECKPSRNVNQAWCFAEQSIILLQYIYRETCCEWVDIGRNCLDLAVSVQLLALTGSAVRFGFAQSVTLTAGCVLMLIGRLQVVERFKNCPCPNTQKPNARCSESDYRVVFNGSIEAKREMLSNLFRALDNVSCQLTT